MVESVEREESGGGAEVTAKTTGGSFYVASRVKHAPMLFDSGIVGHVVRPSKDIEIDLFTPCDPDEGGEGGA